MASGSGDASTDRVAESGDHVYWFLRYLVASRFGNYASKESGGLRQLSRRLNQVLQKNEDLDSATDSIEHSLLEPVSRTYGGDISKRYRQTEDLVERVLRRIETVDDLFDLQIAIDAAIRTSKIQSTTVRFGRDEIVDIVDRTIVDEDRGTILPSRAYEALYNVDIAGEEFQLGAQREGIVGYIENLMEELRQNEDVDDEWRIRIISAVIQEYERRAGQSRAATAGNVLEIALQHLFDRFGIPASGKPEHMGDLEVDNIVEGPEGSIGFSCKRTLRERFRQSLSRQSEIGVDEIWFVALMMADVSRDKILDIKNDDGRIYVPRDSFIWEQYNHEEELTPALYPADEFLQDVAEFSGNPI